MERVFFAIALVFAAFSARSASAQDAADARLGIFTEADRERIAPLLNQGMVSLVEFAAGESLPAVLVATRVNATPRQIADVISLPENYPSTMDLLKSVDVTGRHGDSVAFDWVWQTAVFELRGNNVMTRFDPPEAHPELGYRFDIRTSQGDLGTGRATWRVYPDGQDASLLTFSIRLDLRDANYLSRQMAVASRSVNRAANMSLAYLMMLGIEKEMERVTHRPRIIGTAAPLASIDTNAFAPMFDRGDLVVFHGSEEGQRNVTAFGRMWATRERIHNIMGNPASLGSVLIPGSSAEIVETTPEGQTFAWDIDIPLVGARGRMRMSGQAPAVHVVGVSGSLSQGVWDIEARPLGDRDVVLLTRGQFDPADTSWLLRGLVDGSPGFGHGLASACELMLVRAVRSLASEN